MVRLRGTELQAGDIVLLEASMLQSMTSADKSGLPATWLAVFELTGVQLLKRDV